MALFLQNICGSFQECLQADVVDNCLFSFILAFDFMCFHFDLS